MTERMEAYNETTDLYQQMLWAARKIEDPKLVDLLMSRLKEGAGTIFTTESGCKIISFPCPYVHSSAFTYENDQETWPRQPLLQTLSIIGCYGSLIAVSLMLGLA